MTMKYDITKISNLNYKVVEHIESVLNYARDGKLFMLDADKVVVDKDRFPNLKGWAKNLGSFPDGMGQNGLKATASRLLSQGCLTRDYANVHKIGDSFAFRLVINDKGKFLHSKVTEMRAKRVEEVSPKLGKSTPVPTTAEPTLILTVDNGYITNIAIQGDLKVRIERKG